MDNKLQQLTEKLYNDGLSKGKAEAEALIDGAKAQAQHIVEQAKAQAQSILEEAQATALKSKVQAESEIKMASLQTVARVKQTLEQVIVTKTIDPAVAKAFDDTDFLKTLILAVVRNVQAHGDAQMDVILPKDKETELLTLVQKGMAVELGQGVNVQFSRAIKAGFRIQPANGGYQITFTDSDFATLFKAHIHSKLVEFLFDKA